MYCFFCDAQCSPVLVLIAALEKLSKIHSCSGEETKSLYSSGRRASSREYFAIMCVESHSLMTWLTSSGLVSIAASILCSPAVQTFGGFPWTLRAGLPYWILCGRMSSLFWPVLFCIRQLGVSSVLYKSISYNDPSCFAVPVAVGSRQCCYIQHDYC